MFARFRDNPPEPTPDPDVTAELAPLRDSALLDLTDRHRAAMEEIDALLNAERAKGRDGRDTRLFNALLGVRFKLEPGSEILPLRSTTTDIPGRAS